MVYVAASNSLPPPYCGRSKSDHLSSSLRAYLPHPEGGVIRILGGGVPHGLPPSAALGEAVEVIRQWRSARKTDGADVLRVRRLCPDSASAGGGGVGSEGSSSGYAVITTNNLF